MLTFDSNIVTENVWMSLTRVNLNMKQIYSCYYAIRQQEIFFSRKIKPEWPNLGYKKNMPSKI